MDDLIGAQVGSIRVIARIGGGGMGEVYRGFDTRLERPVALKTIRNDRRLSAEFKARFRREARLLSKVGDPGICQIYELIETPEADFLVLEYLDGQTLGRFAESSVTRERLLRVFVQVAHALGAAHKHRIVHRDLKPENILVTADDQAKILDFGIARSVLDEAGGSDSAEDDTDTAIDAQVATQLHETSIEIVEDGATQAISYESGESTNYADNLTGFGNVIGTRGHMSPEQAAGAKVGTPSDIYALGLCLDRLLPHAVDSAKRTRSGEDADPEVAALIARMLRGDPKRRPSAADVEARLLGLLDRPRLQARRRLLRIGTELALLVLLVVSVAMSGLYFEARRANAEAEVRRVQAEQLVDYLLGELRDRLSELGRLDLLEGVNKRALTYFEAVPKGQATSTELAARMRLLRSLADVRVQRGEIDAATALMQGALADAQRRVVDNPKDLTALDTLAEVHFWLGYTGLEQMRDPDRMLADFGAEIELRQRMLELLPSFETRVALATSHTNRGAGLQGLKRWRESVDDLEAAIAALHLLSDDPAWGNKQRGDLAAALGWLSTAREALGDLTGAAVARLQNVEILDALAKADPDNAIWAQDLGIALNFRATLAQLLGDDDTALAVMNQSCGLLQANLERDPENRSNQRAYAVCSNTRAGMRLGHGEADAALAESTAAAAALDRLLAAEGSQSDWLLQSALTRLRLAEIHEDQGRCGEARASIAAMEAILPPAVESEFTHTQLARRLLVLGRCSRREGRSDEARRSFEAVRTEFGDPAAITSVNARAHLTVALIELGDRAAADAELKILKASGYRGTLLRRACRQARFGDCL